ncbi:MAG: hypothetical protein P8J87_03105, partial [Verrucomicrobiales bacterium]|nr:hypothetical protein [Verrucomicrobiales bacterium]
ERWNGITTPMIQMSSYLVRSNRWRWFDNNGNPTASDIGLVPEVADHPIFGGLPVNEFGEVEIVEVDEFGFPFGSLNLTGATDVGNGVLLASEFSSGRVWISLWEAGTEFYAGSGQTAGGRRVWFAGGAGDNDPKGGENFNATGEQLLLNVVSFLVPSLEDDEDGDGMPDGWEDANGLDRTVNDAALDADGDLLANVDEFRRETNPQVKDTDGDGLEDVVETGTGVFVDAGDTGTFGNLADSDRDGLLDGVETNTGVFVDVGNTGTDPNDDDSDGDTITDGYEVVRGAILDPNVAADAANDPDADGSNNGAEFAVGTDPEDDDSDDDGLKDGVETGGGFYAGPDDTGTDPLDPDADNDGLLDGVETNTDVFAGAGNAGTDPFDDDTDLDGFRDGSEVSLHGTNPVDGGDKPDGKEVMFVGGGAEPGGGDVGALRLMQDVFGLESVSYFQANATFADDELGFDLLVLSSTPGSGDIRDKFQISPVPIINWEEAITDSGSGEFGMSFVGMSKSRTATQMDLLPGHPISDGLPARITLFDGPGPETTMSVDPFMGLTVVGTGVDGMLSAAGGGVVGDPVEETAMLIVAEKGDTLNEFAFFPGEEIAQARRVMLPFTDATANGLTADGVRLFYNALLWAVAGDVVDPGGGDLRFTAISYQDDPLSPEVTLTWTSVPGKEYRLVSTDRLDADRALWTVEIETVPADAGETTTRQVEGDKILDSQRFYIVEEK